VAVTPISPHTGTVTGWNLPRAIASKSTWTIGFLWVMPVWLLKLAPNTSRRSDSFMNQLATGVPLRPSTPQPSGWRSEIWPLALKVVSTGACRRSARASTSGMLKRAPWPTMITGRLAARRRREGGGEGVVRRVDRARGEATLGAAGMGVGGGGGLGDLVGEDEVGDAAAEDRVLAGEVHELGVAAALQDGLTPQGDAAEGGLEVDLLEGAGAEDLGVDLAGERERGGAVDVGVPQTGEQVGRAGPAIESAAAGRPVSLP
jgi:hypothetical protein